TPAREAPGMIAHAGAGVKCPVYNPGAGRAPPGAPPAVPLKLARPAGLGPAARPPNRTRGGGVEVAPRTASPAAAGARVGAHSIVPDLPGPWRRAGLARGRPRPAGLSAASHGRGRGHAARGTALAWGGAVRYSPHRTGQRNRALRHVLRATPP